MGYLNYAGLGYFFGKLKTIFAPISHGHGGATQSAAGFMSAADKKKLDGIAEGANKYSLPTATSNVLGGVKLSDSTSSISSTSGGIAATPAAVFAAIAEAKLAAWPIGSIYMSVNSTSPANLFGGTWERISERFLLGASSSYPADSTGGESAHTLTQSELPNYSLSVANGSNVIRSRTGNYADAFVQTQSGGWGIPNWESKTVTVASGGSGKAHNNMPPYLSVWMWKRTR